MLQPVIHDVVLLAIGYKHCKSKILKFVMTKGAGHTTQPGEPYIAKWEDENLNQMHRRIPRPHLLCLSTSHTATLLTFTTSYKKELSLEKCWVIHDGFFYIIITLIGITIVDAWRAYHFHSNENNWHHKTDSLDFADFMAYDMLRTTYLMK